MLIDSPWIQTVGEEETVPRLQYAKPLTIDFGRDPREPFSTPVEGQEAEITPLFSTADELAARAPATCSSEFLLYADTAVRILGLSKASFLVPAPLALREHKDCAMFVDRLPHRDGLDDTPLVLPHVERTTEDFKIRVTVANLSEKSILRSRTCRPWQAFTSDLRSMMGTTQQTKTPVNQVKS